MVRNNIMPVSSKDIENHLILHRHASIAFLDVIKKMINFANVKKSHRREVNYGQNQKVPVHCQKRRHVHGPSTSQTTPSTYHREVQGQTFCSTSLLP